MLIEDAQHNFYISELTSQIVSHDKRGVRLLVLHTKVERETSDGARENALREINMS